MRSLLRTALALSSVGVVLAACTDQPSAAPTAPAAPRALPITPNALAIPSTCDVNALKTYARGYANKSNDALLSIIGDIPTAQKADKPTSTGAATDKVYDALSRIAAIRGTSAQKSDATAAAFDQLVRGLLACTNPSVVSATTPEPAGGFGGALGRNWAFEVRGKPPTDPSGGAYERGSIDNSWWAAWPKEGTWAEAITSTLTNDRVLIYGYRTSTSPVAGRLGSTFEHFSIPFIDHTSFSLSATLGLCFGDASQITGSPRLNHDKEFLPLPLVQPTCETPVAWTLGALAFGRVSPMQLAQRAVGLFLPQTLYASTLFAGGGVTGSPDDFSPSAVWDLSTFSLSGLGIITDGKTSDQIHVAGNQPVTLNVTITGGGNAPEGTPIVASVVGNNSTIAFFSDNNGTALPTATRYVDASGIVSFAGVRLTKAGGYQIAFQVALDGLAGPQTISNSFNIQNK